MKYFNPSYWFKLWVLSAPLFNSENQGINAKSIDNKKIKDWVSNNTSLESINEYNNLTNSSTNYQPYNLNQVSNQNINPIYQTELETSTHKHRHEKSRRIKKNLTFVEQGTTITEFGIIQKQTNIKQIDTRLHHFIYSTLFSAQEKLKNRSIFNFVKSSNIQQFGYFKKQYNNYKLIINVNIKIFDIFKYDNYPINYSFTDLPNPENNFYSSSFFITNLGEVYEMRYITENWKNWHEIKFNLIFSETSEKADLCVIHLKKIIYFVTDKNNVYEYDTETKKLKKIINTNTNTDESIYGILADEQDDKIIIGEIVGGIKKIYEDASSINCNLYEYWSFKNLKYDNIRQLLKDWKSDFETWIKEYNRQIDEDIIDKSASELRTWKDDKKFQLRTQFSLLKDKMSIIKNHDEIKKINIKISNLKSEIDSIYERIETLSHKISNINHSNELTEWCKINEDSGTLSDLFGAIPIFSEITGGFKAITTLGCSWSNNAWQKFLDNAKQKREIFDVNSLQEKNVTKWTDDFTKSINNEQHLPIDNKTNFVTNNITSL